MMRKKHPALQKLWNINNLSGIAMQTQYFGGLGNSWKCAGEDTVSHLGSGAYQEYIFQCASQKTQLSWLWHVWNSITDLLRMHSVLPGEIGGKRQPGGDPVGNGKHKSQWPGPLPRAGLLPSRSPPTLQEQLMVTHRRHSPTAPPHPFSLGGLGSVERECNTHCWPLLSIIHVLFLK